MRVSGRIASVLAHMKRLDLPRLFCLRGVDIWNPNGVRKNQDVFVVDGRIDAIAPSGSRPVPSDAVDGSGLALLPAGVDAQVHLRVPGQPEKETALTGLRAAARGGYAAVLTMPNTKPVIDTPAIVRMGRAETASAEKETGVEVLWSAAVTMGQEGERLADLEALAAAGVAAFTDDGRGVASDELMDRAFASLEKIGLPFLQHAEVPGHGGVLAPGPSQQKLGVTPYPADAEWKMVERDLQQLRRHPGARYHVLHISTRETIDLLRAAKREGLKVSGEASPHHLLLTVDDIPVDDSSYKMNPPIRSTSDRDALLAGLANGDVDFVATDHAPHEPQKKTGDFASAAFGTTGLETSLRVLLHFAAEGRLTPERVASAFSQKPAEFLGIADRYGVLEAGRPFFAVLVDPKADASPVATSDLESLSKNNCFVGRRLKGRLLRSYFPSHEWTLA